MSAVIDAGCDASSFRVIVVNDGSDAETTAWLQLVAKFRSDDAAKIELLEHDHNLGYTRAVNTGLRHSNAPFVVTLNSDTIVTDGWLDGLIACMRSASDIGITGPLSNAASWQNVPELLEPETGQFAVNVLPDDVTPQEMACIVRQASVRSYPRSTFVNGFCFMTRREVIDAIGIMDEDAFPTGYGEENDFCVRAQDAGFALAYADDTYVFHAKSRSFGHETRQKLSKDGSVALRLKHGAEKFQALVDRVKDTGQMDFVRARVRAALITRSPAQRGAARWIMNQRILFLLPVNGGGGGGHSVVQETMAMRRMGVAARIAVREKTRARFLELYADIPDAHELFVGFTPESLPLIAKSYDVIISTIFKSVALLKDILRDNPSIVPAYYAQDYEPMFFVEGTDLHAEALASYTAIPGNTIFAKTDWICDMITRNHGVPVYKVCPSIDHDVYFPPRPGDGTGGAGDDRFRITAMIRPSTPRRGAGRTMELLGRLKTHFGERVEIVLFGCASDDAGFAALPQDFAFSNLGVLRRPDVADLLRRSDVFIDLSDYQAFGRTGLEAMASGAIAVVPVHGGANEYASDGINAVVVDTFDVAACFDRIVTLLEKPDAIEEMKFEAIDTAARFSPRRAAMTELLVLGRAVAARRSDQGLV